MVCRQHDQRVLEPDLLIDIREEIRKCPVELQDVVLRLKARGAEEMPDVVGCRVANAEIVGDLVIPQSFLGDEGFREIRGYLVARGADREEGREIGVLGCRELMGEGAAITAEYGFPLLIVPVTKEIGVHRVQ